MASPLVTWGQQAIDAVAAGNLFSPPAGWMAGRRDVADDEVG